MSASISTRPISGAAPNFSPMTASWCCIRSAAPTGPDVTNPWIAKYIFPGGYIPALSEVIPAIESAGLLVCDIEILRLHYAETLKAWRERFMARREEAVRLYDERFARMWEFYLACLGNVVPQAEPDEFPDPDHQAPGRGADDARLHRRARKPGCAGSSAASGRGCRSPANRARSQFRRLKADGADSGYGRCRTGQLRLQRRPAPTVAGHRAQFRAGNLFHGVDQHRQPRRSLSRLAKFWNVLSLTADASPVPVTVDHAVTNPGRRKPVPTMSLPPRKSAGCDLLHRRPGRLALNLRNGPENLPTFVRSAARPRDRLRPDRHRRRRRPDRADLSDPDLIKR